MTPEGRVKERIKDVLDEAHAYYHMAVLNGMGQPTLDFTGCHKGNYFAIEAKAPGGMPTARQEFTMKQMRRARAMVFVVSDDESLEQLRQWLKAPNSALLGVVLRMKAEITRLSEALEKELKRFEEHLHAWNANNRWHGNRIRQLETQVRSLGHKPVPEDAP